MRQKHIILMVRRMLMVSLVILFVLPTRTFGIVREIEQAELKAKYVNKAFEKKAERKGLLNRMLFKKVTKKLDNGKDENIRKNATLGMVFGIVAFSSLWFATLGGVFFLVIAGASAIAGDILSIVALSRSKNDKQRFKKARRRAKSGLILSLLTGIIPLVLLLIVIISFA